MVLLLVIESWLLDTAAHWTLIKVTKRFTRSFPMSDSDLIPEVPTTKA